MKDVESKLRRARQYYKAGDLRNAEILFREIIRVSPKNFEALYYLANIVQDMGRAEEAIECYRRAIEANPGFAGTYYNLGSLLREGGDDEEAMAYFKKALELDPSCADIYNWIGVIYESKGQLEDAEAYYRRAICVAPKFAMAHYNLGNVMFRKGAFDEAAAYYSKALQLRPDYAKVYCNLGLVSQEKGRFDDAVSHYRKALELDPTLAEAANNLGRVYQAGGRLDMAERYYRVAIQIRPDDPSAWQNLVFLMLYDSRHDSSEVLSEHLEFARHFESPLSSSVQPYSNDRSSVRRLKIGYVSPDFRRHSVAYFIEPVLAHHDRELIEVFCYSSVLYEDEVTSRIRDCSDHWRDITSLSDGKAAEMIRADGIDLLVDLAGHTSNNRLLLFARKPAPVQLSWIGYPATTGFSSMNYKIVDRHTDPPGMSERLYAEELIRMNESFLCYQPDGDSPGVGEPPAASCGHLTFGSFNNFAKVSPDTFRLWSSVLRKVPGSRMLIKAKSLADKSTREYALEMFGKGEIGAERVELLPHENSHKDHLDLYGRIDIGLDTFPYNGTTTTCEALWMGVPVVTLAGNTHASRVGKSIITAAGLPELVSEDADEYLDIAVRLAADLNRLRSLRRGLREMMRQSPLTDAARFTKCLEDLYRTVWRRWCGEG
ncbi:MAG TPA: tetratricopeptide repeat protein [Thermodesulfovibrionales bacterium]|nr:tetratricopeptide repeat protein [Thermodesulfovibrionales bacterium]